MSRSFLMYLLMCLRKSFSNVSTKLLRRWVLHVGPAIIDLCFRSLGERNLLTVSLAPLHASLIFLLLWILSIPYYKLCLHRKFVR